MSLHDQDLAARLKRYLDRRQPPRRIEGKPTAEHDEIMALHGVLKRNAPADAERLAAWWPVFEARLGEMGSGLWPTEKEIRDAAGMVHKEMPKQAQAATVFDDCKIIGEKMAKGEPVGEGWLYGADAVRLIAGGHVNQETMQRYRSGAFLARKSLYKDEAALAWEAEARARHEAAKIAWRDKERRTHQVTIPTNRALEGFAA